MTVHVWSHEPIRTLIKVLSLSAWVRFSPVYILGQLATGQSFTLGIVEGSSHSFFSKLRYSFCILEKMNKHMEKGTSDLWQFDVTQ